MAAKAKGQVQVREQKAEDGLVAQLKSMDKEKLANILKNAGIAKGIARPSALAHVYGTNQAILANIVKLLSASYVVSDVKEVKTGGAFRARVLQAK